RAVTRLAVVAGQARDPGRGPARDGGGRELAVGGDGLQGPLVAHERDLLPVRGHVVVVRASDGERRDVGRAGGEIARGSAREVHGVQVRAAAVLPMIPVTRGQGVVHAPLPARPRLLLDVLAVAGLVVGRARRRRAFGIHVG